MNLSWQLVILHRTDTSTLNLRYATHSIICNKVIKLIIIWSHIYVNRWGRNCISGIDKNDELNRLTKYFRKYIFRNYQGVFVANLFKTRYCARSRCCGGIVRDVLFEFNVTSITSHFPFQWQYKAIPVDKHAIVLEPWLTNNVDWL